MKSVQWVAFKFVEQDSLPSTGRYFYRTALGSMQYHSRWALWILFHRSQLGEAWNWCAVHCKDLYLHAAYVHWRHGASSQEELRIWFSMKIILCVCILISVLETSNDQAVFVFVHEYTSVLKTEYSEAVLRDWASWKLLTTPRLVRNMAELWYRVSNLNFPWNLKGKTETG